MSGGKAEQNEEAGLWATLEMIYVEQIPVQLVAFDKPLGQQMMTGQGVARATRRT